MPDAAHEYLAEVRRMVRSVRRRQSLPPCFLDDDLESDGMLAVVKAMRSHDPGRGPLAHWVRFKARRAMMECVRTNGRHFGRQLTCDFSSAKLDKDGRVDLGGLGPP